MEIKYEGRNSVWYAFGAASSIIAAAGIDTYLNPSNSRGPMGFDMYFLLWIAYFVFAWFGYLISRAIINLVGKREEKKCNHLYPLVIGFTYAPIFWSLIKIMPNEGIIYILAVAVPTLLAAVAMRFVPERTKHLNQSAQVNPCNPPENTRIN